MSEENRPNLHAVGLMMDITDSIEKRIRGKAGKAGIKEVFPLLSEKINDFVNEVDEVLDAKFGGSEK